MFSFTYCRLLVKTFHEAGEISTVAQRTFPRLAAGVDHMGIDVTCLASSAARFTRDMIGHERDEEAVKIVARNLTSNVLRRLKIKKSIAFFMDGADPLWKVHHLRQYPGKVFDKAFYRSAASPMVYMLEEQIFKIVSELRGSSPVLECLVCGPSTPGPAAMKMTAWLLDLSTRAVPQAYLTAAAASHSGGSSPSWITTEASSASTVVGPAPVTLQDTIVLVGSPEDVHLNAWGATTWTPTTSAGFSTVSFDQRDPFTLTLSDSLEWLTMGDVYTAVVESNSENNKKTSAGGPPPASPADLDPQRVEKQQALSALRTDAVWLYLLAFGSPALGLPPMSGTVSFAQWMTAYGSERTRQLQLLQQQKATTAAGPQATAASCMGALIHAYPSQRISTLTSSTSSSSPAGQQAKGAGAYPGTPSPLRLNVEAMRRVLSAASQRAPPAPAAPGGSGGRYHAAAEHYFEVALQALHAYTHGFLPNPLYAPAEAKAHFGEKGMRGVTVEHMLSHLQFVAEHAPQQQGSASSSGASPAAPKVAVKPGAAAAATPAASASPNARRVSLAHPSSSASASASAAASPYVELFSRCAPLVSATPNALTGAQQLCLSSTKPEYMQQVLPVMVRGHSPTPQQMAPILEAKSAADALPHVQKLLPPRHQAFANSAESGGDAGDEAKNDAAAGQASGTTAAIMDGALKFHPTHYITRSGAAALSPWKHYCVDLGTKSEALNIRCVPMP